VTAAALFSVGLIKPTSAVATWHTHAASQTDQEYQFEKVFLLEIEWSKFSHSLSHALESIDSFN
jgi:hypothetical protein